MSFNLDALKIAVRLNDLHFAEIPFTIGRIIPMDGSNDYDTWPVNTLIKLIFSQALLRYTQFKGPNAFAKAAVRQQYVNIITARYDTRNQLLKCDSL